MGCLAHPGTNVASVSVQEIVGQQFGQPVFGTSEGVLSLRISQFPPDTILEHQAKCLRDFVFKDPQASSLSSPAERFSAMADAPPAAFLVCCQVVTEVDANGVAAIGDSFLTVVQAPVASPSGLAAHACDIWPRLNTLAPVGWTPPAEDPLFLVGASLDPVSRRSSTMSKYSLSHEDHLKDMILSVDGLGLCEVGYVTMQAPASPTSVQLFKSSVADFQVWTLRLTLVMVVHLIRFQQGIKLQLFLLPFLLQRVIISRWVRSGQRISVRVIFLPRFARCQHSRMVRFRLLFNGLIRAHPFRFG